MSAHTEPDELVGVFQKSPPQTPYYAAIKYISMKRASTHWSMACEIEIRNKHNGIKSVITSLALPSELSSELQDVLTKIEQHALRTFTYEGP